MYCDRSKARVYRCNEALGPAASGRLSNTAGLRIQEICSAAKKYLFWGQEVNIYVFVEGQGGNERVQLAVIAVSDVS